MNAIHKMQADRQRLPQVLVACSPVVLMLSSALMSRRFPLTEAELLERLAWSLHRNSGRLRFAARARMADMDDCRGIARAQVEHLRRSGVLVDEIQRLQADCHGLRNPHGPEGGEG